MVIKIDHKKCIGAEKCGKCLEICPMTVFMNVPCDKHKYIKSLISNKRVNKRDHGKKPYMYEIVPYFQDVCNGCGLCEKNCPTRCIKFIN